MFRRLLIGLWLTLVAASVSAGLFDDEEARKAILDLRQKVDVVRQELEQGLNRSNEDGAALRRSLLDLQNQIETLRSELAKLRGSNEQLSRDVAEMQKRQKDVAEGVDERLRQVESVKVVMDGREFMAEAIEKRDFEEALATLRKGDFAASQLQFVEFLNRYPKSGYGSPALFWLGNAQYGTRNYKEAMTNFRSLIGREPDHLRAPEAVLSIANCQIELQDTRGARKTLEDLVKAYPQSEAAGAAKERLARLR